MPRVREFECVKWQSDLTKEMKKALIDKGWTMTHLGKLCGKKASQISRTINNPAHSSLEAIRLICNKLGMDSIPI